MKKIILVMLSILILVGCTYIDSDQSESIRQVDTDSKLMRVHFIDVRQGDSILIESPNSQTMLIDGGTKGSGRIVVEYLREQNIGELDYVVSTHPDADHIGGLISVLESIPIHHFIDSGKVHTSETYQEMLRLVQSKQIPFSVPQTGDHIPLDEALKVEVLNANEKAEDNNEASIVLKVTYQDISFLFTGDAGIEIEKQMLATQDVEATILKAGHHGSNTSSSLNFIKEVNPEATILSYGQDNSYGHPHFEVIQNLQKVNSKIYGTAESGDIIIETNGSTYEVSGEEWTGVGATSSIVPKSKGTQSIIIDGKDLQSEIVGIKNNGSEPVNLNGWQLRSVEGDQIFNFPNITIQPNKTLYITSGSDAKEGNGYIKWTGRQIWLNSGDAAQLLDPKGVIVSEFK